MDAFTNTSFKNERVTGAGQQLINKEKISAQRSGYRSEELIALHKAESALHAADLAAKTPEEREGLQVLRNKVNQAEQALVAAIYRRG